MTLPEAITRYTALAQEKGWYAYSRGEVHKLEEHDSGSFRGIRFEVARLIKAAGFEVPQDERGEWWLMPSVAQRGER